MTIYVDAPARLYLAFWEGAGDVPTSRTSGGSTSGSRCATRQATCCSGTNASHLVPWGEDPAAWYAPQSRRRGQVLPRGGLGLRPRGQQAGCLFRGRPPADLRRLPRAGGLVTFIHVGTATHHLEMTCDDAPDDWYMFVFVLLPEG